jgi:STE24 endopeptidase
MQIQQLSKRLEFPLADVSKIDNLSQGVSHSNAYVYYMSCHVINHSSFLIGFGPFRQRGIVLSSNLISCLTINEILAVVGHEIGHFKFNRMLNNIVFIFNFECRPVQETGCSSILYRKFHISVLTCYQH